MLELATAYPYGLNADRLHPVINVFNLFNRHKRRKRSLGRRLNSKHSSELTLDRLRILYKGGHDGLHRLLTTLYSIRLTNLYELFNECHSSQYHSGSTFQENCFRRLQRKVIFSSTYR